MPRLYMETSGSGKPLVLLHGWAMHSGIWRDFADELSRRYRVTRVDLPGHGRSETVVPFTLATICKALADNLAENSATWLGWSLGAEIAIAMASYYPQHVSRLIMLGGSPCFVGKADWPGMKPEVMANFAEQLQLDAQATLLRFLSLQVKGDDAPKVTLQKLKLAVSECPPPENAVLQQGLALLQETDLRAEFSRLTLPVTAILGELDTLAPVAVGPAMQQLLPGLNLTVIPRSGHAPFLSHQAEIVDAVCAAMDS